MNHKKTTNSKPFSLKVLACITPVFVLLGGVYKASEVAQKSALPNQNDKVRSEIVQASISPPLGLALSFFLFSASIYLLKEDEGESDE